MKKILLSALIIILPLLASCQTPQAKTADEELEAEAVSYYYKEEQIADAKTKPQPLIKPEGKYPELTDFHETPEGDVYFLYREDHTAKEENSLYYVHGPKENPNYTYIVMKYSKEENAFSQLMLEIDEENFLERILAAGENIILFSPERGYIYKKNEKRSSADFPADYISGMILLEENSLVCKANLFSGYLVFDLRTGEKTADYITKEFLYEGIKEARTLIEKDGENQLLVTGKGIYEKEGEEWILKVPAARTSMSFRSFVPQKVWKEGDDYCVSDGLNAYRYSLTPEEGEKITLKVTSAVENAYLKEAVVRYQMENPRIRIDYGFMEGETPQDRQGMDTLLKKVNTELVSEKAADIYMLDMLPWEGYVAKDYFLDLQDTIKPFIGSGEYFDGVLQGYQTKEGMFTVPLYFQADYIIAAEELADHIGSLQEFSQYLTENPDKKGLVPYYYQKNVRGFFLPMLYHYYNQELYRNGKITREGIESFLTAAKIIYDRFSLQEEDKCSYLRPYASIDYYMADELWQLYSKEAGNVSLFIAGEGNLTLVPQIYRYEEYELIPTGRFHPVMLMGIHAGTEYEEEAAAFLQYLISFEKEYNQKENWMRNNIGIPLSKEVITFWLKEWRIRLENDFGRETEFYYERSYTDQYPIYFPRETDGPLFTETLEQFYQPGVYADRLLNPAYAIFAEEAAGYFEGEKALEKTADDLFERINLLQNEED